jgi:glycosyltransferase involved in cell wall biosynthesis
MITVDPARTVVTVHDMIPILGWRGIVPGLSYGRRPRLAEYSFNYLRRARSLLTVSEATKRDLVTFLGCNPDRITVAPNGLEPAFRSWTEAQRVNARVELSLPPRPVRLILTSGHQQYKNHETSLKVLRSLLERREDVRFVHLGRADSAWQAKVEQNGLQGKIISLSNLPLAAVVALFNTVDVLLFPSWYEGFGWPPLQALACGTSVVASHAGSIPEVVGHCGLLRDPSDVDGLTQDIERLLDDQELRRQLASRGIAWAQRFTWHNHVGKAVELYRQIAETA